MIIMPGVFDPQEQAIMRRVLGLGDRTVGSLMTRSHEVVWLDIGGSSRGEQGRQVLTGRGVPTPAGRGGPR